MFSIDQRPFSLAAFASIAFNYNLIAFRYIFDLSEKEALELESIKKRDVVDWYNTYLRQSSIKCRRLAIRLWGCNTDSEDADLAATSIQSIKNLADFKRTSKFYPAICWVIFLF